MEFIDPKLNDYVEAHSSGESDLLKRIQRETNLEVLQPRMLSGHLQGRMLSAISQMIRPDYILEIGTFTGYSALCLAEGLADNGRLITLEKNEELEARILAYFEQSNKHEKLKLLIGDALQIIPGLEDGLDLVFIDADKGNYLNYYKMVIEKMNSNGFILADNVLWSGKVIEKAEIEDIDTKALQSFNKFVQADERVENVLLPVRDGVMLIRKK